MLCGYVDIHKTTCHKEENRHFVQKIGQTFFIHVTESNCAIAGEAFKGTEFKVFGFPVQLKKIVLSIYTFPRNSIGINWIWFEGVLC